MRALHGKFAVVREAESKLKTHTSHVGCTSKYVFLIIEIYSRDITVISVQIDDEKETLTLNVRYIVHPDGRTHGNF